MSINPLFTGPVPKNHPPIYSNTSVSQNARGMTANVLRQTNLYSGNSNSRSSPGPRKKPRMSNPGGSEMTSDGDPFQEFDSFTEDDLQACDMIASQALSQQPHSDPGQVAQAPRRVTSAPGFSNQPHASFPEVVSSAHGSSRGSVATNTQACSGYRSLQQMGAGVSSASDQGHVSSRPPHSRSSHTSATVSSVMQPRVSTPTPSHVQTKSTTRQSNVSGTKIYYRSGSTPPGSHQQTENRPVRSTGSLNRTIQSNVGPKATTTKPEPYSVPNKSGGNINTNGPLPHHTDASTKSTSFSYNAKPVPLQQNADVGDTFHSAPSVGGRCGSTSLTPPKGAVARESPGLPVSSIGKDSVASQIPMSLQQQQIIKYRTEWETAKQELKRLTKDMTTKDGENQVLRQNLSKAKAETSRLQRERLQGEEQRRQQISQLERDLKKEIDSLRTQLQFKEAELMQANSTSSNQRTRPPIPTTSTGPAPATPTKHPSDSVEDIRDSDTFPTQQTFMADNPAVEKGQLRSPRFRTLAEGQQLRSSPKRSPKKNTFRKSPGKVSPAPVNSVSSLTSNSYAQYIRPPRNFKKSSSIFARLQKAPSTDAQIVGSLLQEGDVRTGPCVTGLMGLVQRTGCDRVPVDGTESGTAERPSPAKPKRVFPLTRSCHEQSVELATRAISNILNPPRIPPLPPSGIPPADSTGLSLHHPKLGQASVAQPADAPPTYVTDLLPLLEAQLTSYIDTTHAIAQNSAPPTCTTCPISSSDGSLECSLESTGSGSPSQETLMLEHAETAVLTSMALLRRAMTCSSAVRTAVLQGSICPSSEPLGSDGETSGMEIDPSAPLIDPTQAPSKGNSSGLSKPQPQSADGLPHGSTNHILSKLMRISSMQHGLGNCSDVIESSLSTLRVLILKSDNVEKERLQSLLVHDALYISMSCDGTFIQACHALDILCELVSSWKLVCKLCNQSDSCLLLKSYQCGVHGLLGCSTAQRMQLTIKVISMLLRIMGTHHQGATMLLDTDCHCSMELINAAVLMLRNVLNVTEAMRAHKYPTEYWRYILHEGMLVLHCLAVTDRNFTDHLPDIEKVYRATVTSLSKLHRKIPDVTDSEAGVVQDLLDFIQWDETEWDAEEDEDEEDEENEHMGGAKMDVD